MHTYDITLTISPDLPIWPGDTCLKLERVASIDAGDGANTSRLEMSVHMGTHVDAPLHFLGNGKSVEHLPLNILCGRVYILQLMGVNEITAANLEVSDIPPRTRRLLFKTRNSDLWAKKEKSFHNNYVALTPDAAQYLVNRGIKLVGVDYLSVAPYDNTRMSHEILLRAGVIVLEGINLSGVTQGRYSLYCLPLKLAGADGAPARTILFGV